MSVDPSASVHASSIVEDGAHVPLDINPKI